MEILIGNKLSSGEEFRGLCKNIETGAYDALFNTYISKMLCAKRTAEAAEQKNGAGVGIYDSNDVIVQRRTITTYCSEWESAVGN